MKKSATAAAKEPLEMKPKKKGVGLEIKSFVNRKGKSYLVFKTPNGSYNVFAEVEAKQAARDCGARKESNSRGMWDVLWKKKR
jgi:hypothetical protein